MVIINTGVRRKSKQSSKRVSDQQPQGPTSTVVLQNNAAKIRSAFCTFNKSVFKSLSGNPVAQNFSAYILEQEDQIMERVKPDKMICRKSSLEQLLCWIV